MKKVRTIIIDGIEIQTSLSAVEIADLVQKNQELKKQLEESDFKIANLTMDKIELKKQLEEKENIACDWKDSCLENAGKIEILENQQKEFIDYMENKIYSIEPKGTGINYNCEYDSEEDFISAMEEQSRLNTLKEILSKFKEIIGKDINVTTKGDKDDK